MVGDDKLQTWQQKQLNSHSPIRAGNRDQAWNGMGVSKLQSPLIRALQQGQTPKPSQTGPPTREQAFTSWEYPVITALAYGSLLSTHLPVCTTQALTNVTFYCSQGLFSEVILPRPGW